MKPRILTESFCGRAAILSTATVVALAPLSLVAADVTQTATNTSGTSSFASALSWSNGAAPSAANDYFIKSLCPNLRWVAPDEYESNSIPKTRTYTIKK